MTAALSVRGSAAKMNPVPHCDFCFTTEEKLFPGTAGKICRFCAGQAIAYFIREDCLEDLSEEAEEEAA